MNEDPAAVPEKARTETAAFPLERLLGCFALAVGTGTELTAEMKQEQLINDPERGD